jgi:hypothetical protein
LLKVALNTITPSKGCHWNFYTVGHFRETGYREGVWNNSIVIGSDRENRHQYNIKDQQKT